MSTVQTILIECLPYIKKAISPDVGILSFEPMKAGMTNDSYVFECHEGTFIVRIPGKGSEALINRRQEYEVYQLIKDEDLADDVLLFDPESGIKITRYIEGARVCDPHSEEDVAVCMKVLKGMHDLRLEVDHYFDPWERLLYYESLWGGAPSQYDDYEAMKEKIRKIYLWTKEQPRDIVLSHIDPVADNFLFSADGKVYLIDWEYASMQDKDIDVAMFAVYSLLEKDEIDRLIDIYQEGSGDVLQRKKIYAYIAIMGLVWSNWCEFKLLSGEDFGEYMTGQYRFAKDFSDYFDDFDL
ncbi:MAG TPA: phosphotransferase [Fastidiosipila sp.]|jgi:thiamine kinase-like enzyme|nr:phosphotransferase [Fastidiosipila sp.]